MSYLLSHCQLKIMLIILYIINNIYVNIIRVYVSNQYSLFHNKLHIKMFLTLAFNRKIMIFNNS